MKICMITEGSYPYIQGGVSSWIHSLIQAMPEHQFILYTIAAEKKQKGKFKYKLPSNIIDIQEVFLDQYDQEEERWGQQLGLKDLQKKALTSLILGEQELNWEHLFILLRSPKIKSVSQFLMSRDFFDILYYLSITKYKHIPFSNLFWTVRSMLLPLFQIVRHPIPKADLYHSVTTGYAGVLGSLGKLYYHKPYILTEHGIYSREREEEIIKADWVEGEYKDIWINYFYTLSYCSYSNANQVVTLFSGNKQIEIELGCPIEKIRIIPNGIKVEMFEKVVRKQKDGCEIWVGAIVRVVPVKDIKTMLQSFKLVKQVIPQAKFYIMGPYDEDQEYYEECLQLIDSVQLKDVTFTGQIDLKEHIGSMDVLVLTSISEGQPLALLEGMAAGIPFVTTDVGSCKELLYGMDDGIGMAGMIAPVMNYEKMADSIIHLCKNEKLRMEMGRNGALRVKQFYHFNDQIKHYRALYQSYEV